MTQPLEDLYDTLDQRRRPEDVAAMILKIAPVSTAVQNALRHLAHAANRLSAMPQDFDRVTASLRPQLDVAAILFAVTAPADAQDVDAVSRYLAEIESRVGKQIGRYYQMLMQAGELLA